MNKTPASKAAAALGSIKTEKKAAAARENGTKGGRPRKDEVLARTYGNAARGAGPTSTCELIRTVRGKFFVAIDGRIVDARADISLADAQEWYDEAGYQIGARPE